MKRRNIAIAPYGALPLEHGRSHIRLNAEFTLLRDLGRPDEGFEAMTIGRDFRAITRGAQARPGAALLRGLLLLSVP
jgi:hypothetical protein